MNWLIDLTETGISKHFIIDDSGQIHTKTIELALCSRQAQSMDLTELFLPDDATQESIRLNLHRVFSLYQSAEFKDLFQIWFDLVSDELKSVEKSAIEEIIIVHPWNIPRESINMMEDLLRERKQHIPIVFISDYYLAILNAADEKILDRMNHCDTQAHLIMTDDRFDLLSMTHNRLFQDSWEINILASLQLKLNRTKLKLQQQAIKTFCRDFLDSWTGTYLCFHDQTKMCNSVIYRDLVDMVCDILSEDIMTECNVLNFSEKLSDGGYVRQLAARDYHKVIYIPEPHLKLKFGRSNPIDLTSLTRTGKTRRKVKILNSSSGSVPLFYGFSRSPWDSPDYYYPLNQSIHLQDREELFDIQITKLTHDTINLEVGSSLSRGGNRIKADLRVPSFMTVV